MVVHCCLKMKKIFLKSLFYGFLGTACLLIFYFIVLNLVSGWPFTLLQFSIYWYFIVTLAAGFGVQIGLFTYLKTSIHDRGASGKVVAATGTTSTLAMISCCAHYLVNLAPVIGATGLISFVAQYQIQFFWIGLAFNAAGILYILKINSTQ